MQQQMIYTGGARRNELLILFCNGWSMTPAATEHLSIPQGYDLLHLWDYRNNRADLSVLSSYKAIWVVAWSMGVWAVEQYLSGLLKKLPVKQNIAIAGTPFPMHNEWGIPEAIFKGTLDLLTDSNRDKFNRRMCGGKSLRHLFEALKQRSTEEIRQELLTVYENQLHLFTPSYPWSKALIGEKDLIVPAINQKRYWNKAQVPTILLSDGAHYLFSGYNLWEEIINL
jgi:biotin synthesis protein BioG